MPSNLAIRPARARDVVRFSRYKLPQHFIGLAAESAGEVLGVGVIIFQSGRAFACFEQAGRLPAIMLHRMGRKLIRAASATGELFAQCEGEDRWLVRLGFQPTDEVLHGARVYRYERANP